MGEVLLMFEKMSEDAVIPSYAHGSDEDAGMDIRSIEDKVVLPGDTVLIHTGLKVVIPKGYYLAVVPRSGLSLKSKIRVANAPGTIDPSYRGEIGIIIDNLDLTDSYTINKGDRIAQLVLKKYESADIKEIVSVDEWKTDRSAEGFGSTGID